MAKSDGKKVNKELTSFYSICKETFFPPIDLSKYQISGDVLSHVPERIAIAYQVVPVSYMGNVLTVAMSDPLNVSVIDNLRLVTAMEISPVIAPASQVIAAIRQSYSLEAGSRKKEIGMAKTAAPEISPFETKKFDVEEITKLSKDTKIVSAVNKILSEAAKLQASDIHVEPFEDNVRLRYRVDGILREIKTLHKDFQEAVIARLKIMSSLDITQRRVPQDGRFTFRVQERDVDVRVSVLPTDFGEKIVLRLLDKTSIKLTIDKLGFSSYAFDAFNDAVSKPLGMILLTGPTGSGKTTTLYTLLNILNTPQRSLVTIEDPVEYNLNGVAQVPIKHEIGLGFASILRATLRQSPDVIMVGEIRDSETVDIAMKAALTGHIVFSTLHTNDAPSAITRLLDMAVEPFLISFSLNMIAAQRLVRRICPNCKVSYTVDLTQVNEIPAEYKVKKATLYKGKGCKDCDNSGYKGRMAIVEALLLDEKVREMVIKRVSAEEIREYARKHLGMKTLREDAMDKCLKGDTTIDELLRVTMEF